MQNAIKREELFGLFLDRITDGFIVLDTNFNYLYVNKRIGELVQRDPESLIGKNVWKEFPEAADSLTHKAFQTAMKEQRFISNIDYFEPLDLWQENYIYPSPEGISVFIRDISEQKKLQKQLMEQERSQQFEIMITGLEAQEKERTNIAQELHDNVNQMLTATKLTLDLYRNHVADLSEETLAKCIGYIETAIEENRRISHELITPDLKEQTLTEQLQFLLHSMLDGVGIDAQLKVYHFDEALIDETRKLTVYRIAQEQCTNIVKHAKAKHVVLSLSMEDGQLHLQIMDDGKGTDAEKAVKGIGLRNIQGRVRFFDGSLSVETAKGKGFKLEVTMPVEPLHV